MSFAQRKCLRLSASRLVQILRVLHSLSKEALHAPLLDLRPRLGDELRPILRILEEPRLRHRHDLARRHLRELDPALPAYPRFHFLLGSTLAQHSHRHTHTLCLPLCLALCSRRVGLVSTIRNCSMVGVRARAATDIALGLAELITPQPRYLTNNAAPSFVCCSDLLLLRVVVVTRCSASGAAFPSEGGLALPGTPKNRSPIAAEGLAAIFENRSVWLHRPAFGEPRAICEI